MIPIKETPGHSRGFRSPQALGQDGDGGLAVDHDQGGRGHLLQLGAHHRPVLADGQAEQVGVGASARTGR